MPADFDKCVKNGGKVWTKSGTDYYQHFCTLKGKTYAGEKHKKTKDGKEEKKK